MSAMIGAPKDAYIESHWFGWRLWDKEPTDQQMENEPWYWGDKGIDDFAAFGTALDNLRKMNGMIEHTQDVEVILNLIDGRIGFLTDIPQEVRGDSLGELYMLKTMICAMCGELRIEEGEEE